MPEVRFQGRIAVCREGVRLRDALLDAGMTPHHPAVSVLNCHGLGTCGTCAVAVSGEEGSASPTTARERLRLRVPPHHLESGLRLACQCRVLGDLDVVKHPGLWGQNVSSDASDDDSVSDDRLSP